MKASLQLREDHQAPIVKAKVPFSLLNLPLTSSIAAGDPADLQLGIATAFISGPTIHLNYRPNNGKTPFAVSVRVGAGEMGSPVGSAIVMKAEVGSGTPRFSIVFKPRFGDFRIRKFFQSNSRAQETSNISENGVRENGFQGGGGDNGDNGSIYDMISGTEATTISTLPVRNGAAEVRFRWGVRLPSSASVPNYMTAGGSIPPSRLPYLVMSKISVERVRKDVNGQKVLNHKTASSAYNSDMMEKVRTENHMLRKEVADLWSEVVARRKASAEVRQTKNERRIEQKPTSESEKQTFSPPEKVDAAKSINNEAAEELRKALMGSAVASGSSKK
ncbi:CCAAT/enhancer-binding protein delta [Rhynchospora pubera]|uniref:CCAAT/enhancer-binding protein delta n=1 Tax=Rhynchospora pubera TaxID=906938 RepID=A0AAV8CKR1_9POAL|nr:CCAAT/enhancer-binding protein delta [Rhynchospora pubera]